MKAKSKLVTRLSGSLSASPPSLFLTAQTRKDGSMRIGRLTLPGPSNTPSQEAWRSRYAACVDEWNIMSPEQKEEYSKAAKAAGLTNYNVFISSCLLGIMATEVIQSDPTKLKATVTQKEKDRHVTQAAKDRTITGNVGVLDALENRIFPVHEYGVLFDTKTVIDAIDTTLKAIRNTNGIKKITDPVTVNLPGNLSEIGMIYDNLTDKYSVAVSRGAGKNTFTDVYSEDITDEIILSPEPGQKLMIVGILTAIDADTGNIMLDFAESGMIVWRHYGARFKSQPVTDMSLIGDPDEDLILNTTQGENDVFILINYRSID